MKCHECRSLIEEYFDDELDQREADAVKTHLEGCMRCAAIALDLNSEREMYASYDPNLEVSTALWAGIQSRLATPERAPHAGRLDRFRSIVKPVLAMPRVSAWATALLVLVAIGGTAMFMKYRQAGNQQSAPASVAATQNKPGTSSQAAIENTGHSDNNPAKTVITRRPEHEVTARNSRRVQAHQTARSATPNQLVREAEQKYLAAIALLSRSADRKRSQMDSATRAKLDQAIASMDRTIAGTRKVVREHPDDPVAVQYMLTAYARKVDVLREIAGH